MAQSSNFVNESVVSYVKKWGVFEPKVAGELSEFIKAHKEADMQASSEVTSLLSILSMSIRAKNILEIGTFTGYTTLALMETLPKDARIVTCELNTDYIKIAEEFWSKAGVRDRIDLRIGKALDCTKEMKGESFDLAFIDADKENYTAYFDECLRLVRKSGLIIVDNTLFRAEVLKDKVTDPRVKAIKELNEKVHRDERVHSCLLTVSDGLIVAVKK